MSELERQSTGAVTSAAAANYAYNCYIEKLPFVLMQQEWDRYAKAARGANKWAFPPIATARKNPTVKMSPDVLYSFLSYDVSDRPLRLSVPVSRDPFWSLTLFQDNTDNFFGLDDRDVKGDTCELIILGPNQSAPAVQDVRVAASPSSTGIAVVRCVVPSPDKLKELDMLRKRAEAASL